MPKITVAMPIHNTGRYLDDSIQSIMQQSFSDFELICIDDASSDEYTVQRLDYYAKLDSRIIVHHLKKNIGPGPACNIALDEARGDYFIRFDSDDVCDFDMLEKMLSQSERFNAEMCVCTARLFSTITGEVLEIWPLGELENQGGIERPFCMKDFGKDSALSYSPTSGSNKLIRLDFLRKNDLRFAPYRFYEEGVYSDMASLLARRIVYANEKKPLFSYRRDVSGQLTEMPPMENALQYVTELWRLNKNNKDIQVIRMVQHRFIRRFIMCMDKLEKGTRLEQIYLNAQNCVRREMPINYLHDSSWHAWLYLECLRNLSCDTEWYKNRDSDYYLQIRNGMRDIIESLHDESKRMVIFGNGRRSAALQRILCHEGIEKVVVTDIDKDKITKTSDYGYPMTYKECIGEYDIGFATNNTIYKNLIIDGKTDYIINIEQYCLHGKS